MCYDYSVLDRIWLIPVVAFAAFGVFVAMQKLKALLRSKGKPAPPPLARY